MKTETIKVCKICNRDIKRGKICNYCKKKNIEELVKIGGFIFFVKKAPKIIIKIGKEIIKS